MTHINIFTSIFVRVHNFLLSKCLNQMKNIKLIGEF